MRDTGFYDAMADQSAERHRVPVSYIKAVIGAETSFEIPAPRRWEAAVSEYAYGPMQILLSTARDFYPAMSAAELETPEVNVDVGAAYIRNLMDRYGEDFRSVYSAYNSGNPNRWQTSAQVRSNVDRALTWLEQFVPAEIIDAGATVSETPAFFAGVALVALIWLFRRR
jgi:soluble lytic murein transglycosylase